MIKLRKAILNELKDLSLNIQKRKESLATFLNVSIEDIDCTDELENIFSIDNEEYLVLTYEEAREKTEEYIKDSLCYFNPDFIYYHSIFNGRDEDCIDIIKAIQEKENSSLIEDIIEDIDSFIEDAICCDGIGHFLATYDHEENSQGDFLIYRVN